MERGWGSRFLGISKHMDALLAFGVVSLVLLLIIPLPPVLLDLFLCFSIVLSIMVLLLTFYIEDALEFSAFPSVLLFLTLFRLCLNVGSTRMILTEIKAGDIIRTFGDFVIQGNEIVGITLFILLTVVNFIVVTKGAGRIAEVAARFTLEALPGKQMSIESELNAGLISQAQAKEARKKIVAESHFYGSMDGASKFVKGDAIAGTVIIFINLLGGFGVGVLMKGMTCQACWTTIARLTIGDGLVSQIPALLVSVSAALMVTRAAGGSIGQTLPHQIFRHAKVFMISGSILLVISFIPGMPFWVMFPISGGLIFMGLKLHKQKKEPEVNAAKEILNAFVSPLEVKLGYQSACLAKPLQKQLEEIRSKVFAFLGMRIPSIHITDDVDLSATGWVILIKGVKIVSGRDADLKLLMKQIKDVAISHAHELITRQDISQMLQEAKRYDSALVDEIYPKKLSLGQILKVLQNLLREQIPVRDFMTILDVLANHAQGEKTDVEDLSEKVRHALSGNISETIFGKNRIAYAITVDPKVEQMLTASKGTLRPKAIDQIAREIMSIQEKAREKGIQPVVITATGSRVPLKKIMEKKIPELSVLSYQELSAGIEVKSLGIIPQEVLI